MLTHKLTLEGLLAFEPSIHTDHRGFFYESYSQERYEEHSLPKFVQDNISSSYRGVFRGLHIQTIDPQAKLITCLQGAILDFAVDLRKGSETFGKWESISLGQQNAKQFYIPAGFAHGFYVLSETALVAYKASDYWNPKGEVTIDFTSVGISLPSVPLISAKDANGISLDQFHRLNPDPQKL